MPAWLTPQLQLVAAALAGFVLGGVGVGIAARIQCRAEVVEAVQRTREAVRNIPRVKAVRKVERGNWRSRI